MLKRNRIMLHLLTIDYVSENTYTGVKISIRGHARSTWAHFMWEKYTTRLWTGWCSLNLLDANYPCSHSRTPNMCEHTVLPTPKPQNGCLRPDITIILVEKNITLSVDIFSNVSHYFFLLRKSHASVMHNNTKLKMSRFNNFFILYSNLHEILTIDVGAINIIR